MNHAPNMLWFSNASFTHTPLGPVLRMMYHIDGSLQGRCNSSASSMELGLFCIKPSTYSHMILVVYIDDPIHHRQNIWNIGKTQWKYSHLKILFVENGLVPTTNK